ncbi:28244_t:CDS:1, partial [Racocetra persica]
KSLLNISRHKRTFKKRVHLQRARSQRIYKLGTGLCVYCPL